MGLCTLRPTYVNHNMENLIFQQNSILYSIGEGRRSAYITRVTFPCGQWSEFTGPNLFNTVCLRNCSLYLAKLYGQNVPSPDHKIVLDSNAITSSLTRLNMQF
jgi:hypothetical protein